MRTIRHRPSLRAATLLALCALTGACSQLATRGALPADAETALQPAPHPEARVHALDPVHTRIAIAVDHAGFSKAIGTVSGTTGTLHLVPGSWEGAHVVAEIPLSQLDFGDGAWNRAVAASGLLDSGRHPVASFRSTRVEPLDAGQARIHGELTMRGTTREVVLEAVRNAERRHPLPPFRSTVGFSATATLSRSEFGSTAWGSMIGDVVEVRIEVEAVR
ncbi:YceI family protein [Luteimonas terricola]|uniref:Polyisoprenoid-binding protein n=1 Tax=Luteimonas terricola TaxID=645597 RepID=A0ABQ2EI94_9GAMM|nr:YceI family protein [Luteimonas terricola]GGK12276.1 polyisoprenoid-binding protein [Luteimonas terricola]